MAFLAQRVAARQTGLKYYADGPPRPAVSRPGQALANRPPYPPRAARGRNALRSRRRLRNLVVVMGCSFCNGGGPPYGNHNVRTCELLQLATVTFIAQEGRSLTFNAFKKAAKLAAETVFLTVDIGLTVVTAGGAAPIACAEAMSVAKAAYDLYNYARQVIDLNDFVQMSKRKQAAYLIQYGYDMPRSEALAAAQKLY